MKSKKNSQSCPLTPRKRSRSLNASHYYKFTELPKHRVSQAAIIKTETISETSRRQLFHHRTMLIDKILKQGKLPQKKRDLKEKMYEQNESHQRRLSCCCDNCGKQSSKMVKYHNIWQKPESPTNEFWSSLILQQQQQTLLTISSKSLKSTATLFSIPDVSPNKKRVKIESPNSKKIKQNPKHIPTQSLSINLKPYLWESPKRKIATIQSEMQPITLRPITLRASAPNLETLESFSKNNSPTRGKSNQTIKFQDTLPLTQRSMNKKLLASCYLKTFSGISINNRILNIYKK